MVYLDYSATTPTNDDVLDSFVKCSKEFIDAFNSADLIISKGQGNFESLHDTTRPIVFLFLSKCDVISKMLNSSLKTIQIKTANF